MKRLFAATLIQAASLLCGMVLCGAQTVAQPRRQSVRAQAPVAAKLAQPLGILPTTEPLSVAITLPFRNQEALTNLLRDISNPKSPDYRHYLTREEFTERFGPSEQDYNAVKKFAQAHGLGIRNEHANRMMLEVGGTVGDNLNTLSVHGGRGSDMRVMVDGLTISTDAGAIEVILQYRPVGAQVAKVMKLRRALG